MDTATQAAPTAEHVHGPHVYHDPQRDIDAPKTVFWLVVCSVAFFAAFYLLYVFFAFAIQEERATKVEDAPTPQLDELRAWEDQELKAKEGMLSIEDAMKKLAERRR